MPEEERQLGFRDERPEDLNAYLERIQANRYPLSLLAAGLTDVRNIGALFRLADAARIEHLYFYGWPEQLNAKKLKRVSRSTVDYVPHTVLDFPQLQQLSQEKTMVGLEITADSQPYYTFDAPPGTVLVLGQEAHGIPDTVLQLCTACVHLPMRGVNTSMNVAMAAGIAVYGLMKF